MSFLRLIYLKENKKRNYYRNLIKKTCSKDLNHLNFDMSKFIAKYSELVQYQHINAAGSLFGGYMLAWLDLAAGKAANRFVKDTEAYTAVTRAMDKVEFKEPVFLGDWVNCEAEVIEAGTSSIEISVSAYAESKRHGRRLACTAHFTFVTVIKNDKGEFLKYNHNVSLD